jgi:hypothetical protein
LRASVSPIFFEALDLCVPWGELANEALHAVGVDFPSSNWVTALRSIQVQVTLKPNAAI